MRDPSYRMAPIDALPVELLQHIFTLITNDPSRMHGPLRKSAEVLLHVSHRWRLTALAEPSLWTSFGLPGPVLRLTRRDWLTPALSRLSAFSNPDLHITLEELSFARAPPDERQRFTTFLRTRRTAWRTMYLDEIDAESMDTLFDEGADAEAEEGDAAHRLGHGVELPRLEELIMRNQQYLWGMAEKSLPSLRRVLSCTPALRKLKLVGFVPPAALSLCVLLPQLESLDLVQCVKHSAVPLSLLCSALSTLKTLRTLCISTQLWFRGDMSADPGRGQKLHLPNLRTFVVRTKCHEPRLARIIQLLCAPRLSHLQLSAEPCGRRAQGSDRDAAPIAALTQKQDQEHWRLETLDMCIPHWHADDLMQLLSGQAQQGVKCVVLDEAGVRALLRSGLAAAASQGDGEGENVYPAPALEELVVLDGWRCIGVVLELVRARAAAAAAFGTSLHVARMRRVRLLGARGWAPERSLKGSGQGWGRDVPAEEALLELVEVYRTWEERPDGFMSY